MSGKYIAIGIVALVVLIGGGFAYTQFGSTAEPTGEVAGTNTEQAPAQLPTDTVGVQDTTVGTGREVAIGSTVTVNYTGALPDGTVFDSSIPRGEPFVFTLGEGKVIPGWEAGLLGMKEGGTRILAIPPQFAYGEQAYGPIPANSTLIFQVELLKVE